LDRRAIGQESEPALPRAHAERLTEKAGSIFKAFQLSKDVSPFVVVGLAPAIHVLAATSDTNARQLFVLRLSVNSKGVDRMSEPKNA